MGNSRLRLASQAAVQRDGVEGIVEAVLHVVVEINAASGAAAGALVAVIVVAAGVAGGIASTGAGGLPIRRHAGGDGSVTLALVVLFGR